MSDYFNGLLSDEEASFLELYKEDLEAIPSLSDKDREKNLEKAKKGDDDAQGLLIQDFMHTALDVTHMYAGQGILLQDLIGEGNLALVSFFKNVPAELTTADLEEKVTEELVRVYDDLIKAASDEEKEQAKIIKKTEQVAKAAKTLSEELGRKVTVDELHEKSKISKKQITDALKNTANKIEGLKASE